jgi:RNA polymerase sigma-70 factor (ECF subfamily)
LDRGHTYNEAVIIQELAKGSQSAFDIIYLRYFDKLVAQVVELVKDTAAAEDIVQDAFFKMWEKRVSFTQYDKVSGWLFVTTYNSALNNLRKKARDNRRLSTVINKSGEQEESDFIAKETMFRLMEEAIEQLPPQRKKVFQLCKLGGLSYDQAAEQLSLSRNTVKEHIAKAVEFIRNRVGESYDRQLALYIILLKIWF